jgi:high-affinity K+ transport system ATPase subunit B
MTTVTAQPSALSWFLSRGLLKTALIDSFRRLTPRYQWRNPVMFVVYIGAILTTILLFQALGGKGEAPAGFILAITLWLWVTLLFANFAEAIAEGRSKASPILPRRSPKAGARRRRPRSRVRARIRPRNAWHVRTKTRRRRPHRRRTCARAIWSWSSRATWSPATAT